MHRSIAMAGPRPTIIDSRSMESMNKPAHQFVLAAKPEVPNNSNPNEVLHSAQCRAAAKLVDKGLHRLHAMSHMDGNASRWVVLNGFRNGH